LRSSNPPNDADLTLDASVDDGKVKLSEAKEIPQDVCGHDEESFLPYVELEGHEMIQ
jgi:hypothetical protein